MQTLISWPQFRPINMQWLARHKLLNNEGNDQEDKQDHQPLYQTPAGLVEVEDAQVCEADADFGKGEREEDDYVIRESIFLGRYGVLGVGESGEVSTSAMGNLPV